MFKIRDFSLEVKASADGRFEGYGSVFGVVDSYNEVVAPGAFSASLSARAAKGNPLPILWQHRADMPIGVYDSVAEDSKGLRVTGRLLVNDVALAKEAHALLNAKAVSGLSIGYWTRNSSYDERTGVRTLTQLDLEEVSLVTFPANDAARVDAVKMKMARGSLPSLPEFEAFLRDAGMPKSKAAAIANRGLASLLGEPAELATSSELVSALKGLKLPTL